MTPVLVSGRNSFPSQQEHSFLSYRGDYRNCDLPYWTAEAILRRIVEVEKVNLLILSRLNTSMID